MNKIVFISRVDDPVSGKLAELFASAGDTVITTGEAVPGEPFRRVPEAGLRAGNGAELYKAVSALTDRVDLFIDTTLVKGSGDDKSVTDGLDTEGIVQAFRENTLGPLSRLEALLPLLDTGSGRRCAFFTTRHASVNMGEKVDSFGTDMAKGALHNIIACCKNRLEPEGYTFRMFDPMTDDPRITPEAAAGAAYTYITRDRGYDPFNNTDRRHDEKSYVLRDALGRVWPW